MRLAVTAIALLLTAPLVPAQIAAADIAPGGEWVETGPPIGTLATGGSLVILADGASLLFGLDAGAVQQYHPETGAWTAAGVLQMRRGTGATVTVLPFDVVLLAGGVGSAGTTAEVYDPAAGTSSLTGSMHFARTGHRATLLASGKVLVSGGVDANNHLVGQAEVYDPLKGPIHHRSGGKHDGAGPVHPPWIGQFFGCPSVHVERKLAVDPGDGRGRDRTLWPHR